MFAKIYSDLQKNNQRHKGKTLKIILKSFHFGPKSVEVSLNKTQATTAIFSWKIDDHSSQCVQKYRVQVDGESKDANLIKDTKDTKFVTKVTNLMPCSSHKIKISPIYNSFIGIAEPIE